MNGNWPKVMLMSGLTSAWLLYDIAAATEAPDPVPEPDGPACRPSYLIPK